MSSLNLMSPLAPYEDFKEVIDREGHEAGDKLLSHTASVLNAATKKLKRYTV